MNAIRPILAGITAAAMSMALSAQTPTFRSVSTLVSVPVSVLKNRQPVAGLTAADFSLTDNGVPQKIDAVYGASTPIDLTLIVDTSGSVEGVQEDLVKQARRVSESLAASDRLRLLAIDTAVQQDAPFQTSIADAVASLKIRGGISAIHDAIGSALLQTPVEGRRALTVAMTDGYDTGSVLSAGHVQQLAETSDTVLHVVIVKPTRMSSAMRDRSGRTFFPVEEFNLDGLALAAATTGGALHKTGLFSASAADYASRVVKDFRQSYVVVYEPVGVARGGSHTIAVGVPKHPEFSITARRSYSDR